MHPKKEPLEDLTYHDMPLKKKATQAKQKSPINTQNEPERDTGRKSLTYNSGLCVNTYIT